MDLLEVESLDNAINLASKVMKDLGFKKTVEKEILDSKGYILASNLVAKEDLPHFRKSTMDGYAINYKDSLGATDTIPSIIKVVETIEIGNAPTKAIKRGEASRIFTGGMLPDGADAVIPVEYTEDIPGDLISIYKPMNYLTNVIEIGDDTKKGDVYLKKGKVIDSNTIAMAASLGYSKLKVYDKLKCILISTGDEIIGIDEKLEPAKSRNINSYMLKSMLEDLPIDVISEKLIRDDRNLIEKELKRDVDLIVISGSSSKGNKDFVPDISKNLNPGMIFHGISIKPGKPTSLSVNNNTMILGLPGNPISAYASFKVFFEKAFKRYFDVEDDFKIECVIDKNIATTGREEVKLLNIRREEDKLVASPIFGFSNNISLLKKANGYMIISKDLEGIRIGEKVRVNLIK